MAWKIGYLSSWMTPFGELIQILDLEGLQNLPRSLCVLEPAFIPLGKKKPDILLKQQIGLFGTHFGTRNRKLRAMTQRQKLIHWPPIYFKKLGTIWWNHQTCNLFAFDSLQLWLKGTIDSSSNNGISYIVSKTQVQVISGFFYCFNLEFAPLTK